MKKRRAIIDFQTSDDVNFSDALEYVRLLMQVSKLSASIEAIELKEMDHVHTKNLPTPTRNG